MAPLYLNEQQSILKKRDECLIIQYADKRKAEVPLIKVSQVIISGDVTVTAPAMHLLLENGIEVCFLSLYGQYRGRVSPSIAKNARVRREQYRMCNEPEKALLFAQKCVNGKLQNMRTLLLRANRTLQDEEMTEASNALKVMIKQVDKTTSLGSLLGVEGNGSAHYFRVLGKLIRPPFQFTHRRRRPPRDPVNALLSLGYTLVLHQVLSAIQIVGFDPYLGCLHQLRHGKPALALDLMEEFRPILADSTMLNILNHHILVEKDFQEELGVVYLKPDARKTFYAKFEERLQEEIHHPFFGYRTTYRRCIELQVRLLAKYLLNEIPEYIPFRVR